jgi:hypothetical protein
MAWNGSRGLIPTATSDHPEAKPDPQEKPTPLVFDQSTATLIDDAQKDCSDGYVSRFANHWTKFWALAGAGRCNPNEFEVLYDYQDAAKRMWNYAKEVRTLSAVYAAVDDSGRAPVRPIFADRLKEIAIATRLDAAIPAISAPDIKAEAEQLWDDARRFHEAVQATLSMAYDGGGGSV